MKKLSAIIQEMAMTLLRRPDSPPSSEAAHAALLFAHVAWNKALGDEDARDNYRLVLSELEDHNPALWNEFKSTDHREIIESLSSFKERRYANDRRVIKVCGMRMHNVHVEWVDG